MSKARFARGAVLPCLFLGGSLLSSCAPPGHWIKPGVGQEESASDYRQCALEAKKALATDRAIHHDILATRGSDWERAGTLGVRREEMRHEESAHGEAVFDSCMSAKGYSLKR